MILFSILFPERLGLDHHLQTFHFAPPMKQVKPNMANKTVYIQTFDLLEHSNQKLFDFHFQFN